MEKTNESRKNNQKKKVWEKPCLTVILRGRIEENILGICGPPIDGVSQYETGS